MRAVQPTELTKSKYRIYSATNMRFPYHIHRTYEIIAVVKGTVVSVIDGIERTVHAGSCAVVFPLQYHSYKVERDSEIKICVFTPEFIPEFDNEMRGKIPADPIVSLSPFSADTDFVNDIFVAKAMLYSVCGMLSEHLSLIERKQTGKIKVLDEIFLYIDNHFKEDCSLKKISKHFGYDYGYISKQFKFKTGTAYNKYLNNYRVNKACSQIINHSKKTITQIAADSGFSTLRTFNRQFFSVTGMTPLQYRRATLK